MLTRKDYQFAVYSQDACNSSGLIFDLAKVMHEICHEDFLGGKGTDWKNRHPIVVLYITQLAHLAQIATVVDTATWDIAYRYCIRMAEHEHEIEAGRCTVCQHEGQEIAVFDGKEVAA